MQHPNTVIILHYTYFVVVNKILSIILNETNIAQIKTGFQHNYFKNISFVALNAVIPFSDTTEQKRNLWGTISPVSPPALQSGEKTSLPSFKPVKQLISMSLDWLTGIVFQPGIVRYADRIQRKVSMKKVICSESLYGLWLKGHNGNSGGPET